MDLRQRINDVENEIQRACERSGRERSEVHVIAVTKYISTARAMEAVQLGCKHIGENRWPDALEKWEAIGDQATWHFIGQLQRRKVKHVVERFSYIHSVDRWSLAEEIGKRAEQSNKIQNCFIQVNVSGEQSKAGVSPNDLFSFADELRSIEHMKVIGLMTMAPYESNPEHTRPVFQQLRHLRDQINERQIFEHPLVHLSMGMSNDFTIAIEEGATWVRLGSVLVGKDEDPIE